MIQLEYRDGQWYEVAGDTQKPVDIQPCEAGNNGIGENREDRFVVCELDVVWRKYSREELVYLCERYCEQKDGKK